MKTIYLQSMTDFVLELASDRSFAAKDYSFANPIINYANFLKQLLELGFFVPCFETGEIFNKPFGFDSYMEHRELSIKTFTTGEIERCKLYEKAKERVLFKGFEYVSETKETWLFKINGNFPRIISKKGVVEFLNMFKDQIQLTDSAIKQIGL